MSWFEYINRGPDKRPLGVVGAVLQNLLSLPFSWKHEPPADVKLGKNMLAFPPFVAINMRVGGRWRTLRFGWRYDVNAKRYIFDIIVKLREETPLYY